MATARRDWDAIVIGLGAIGSGAAYWLSRTLGAGVLGLEQFEFDHVRGASADHSRIIRLSYHRPDYVRLARRAYESWAVVESEAGEPIVTVTGGLDLWPADPAIPQADYTASLTAEGVPFELLDAVAFDRCKVEEPPLSDVGGGQAAACWLANDGELPIVPAEVVVAPAASA
jgi:sarcosine oxidase